MSITSEKIAEDKSVMLLCLSVVLVLASIGFFVKGCQPQPTPTINGVEIQERIDNNNVKIDSLQTAKIYIFDTIRVENTKIIYLNKQIKEKQDEVANFPSDSAYAFFVEFTGAKVISD
jgi:hypothetical protein